MGPLSGAFGRAFVITALAAAVTGCEGEALLQEEQVEEAIPGVSDTCEIEAGDVPVHLDGDVGAGPDLFVLSVVEARDGETIDVMVDRERDTVLVLASSEPVRWNVSSVSHVRVITVEGDHVAVERAVVGTELPLAGFHGCRRSGSFGIYD